METGKHDGCVCPRCQDRIAEQFYCCTCGYLPEWPRSEFEEYEACRVYDDGNLYPRRDEEIEDGAQQHASAGVRLRLIEPAVIGIGKPLIYQSAKIPLNSGTFDLIFLGRWRAELMRDLWLEFKQSSKLILRKVRS